MLRLRCASLGGRSGLWRWDFCPPASFVHNVCSVFDVFTVPNSFDPKHALGIFSAIINSMKIKWSGVTRSVLGFSDATNKFRGDFFACSATIAVSARTPKDTGHGLHFESDPATTANLAQFGTEHNGVFFVFF